MGRFYTVTFTDVALTAAADLFEVTAATDKPVRIWHWNISQNTDLSDAAEEVLKLTLKRGVTAGSGGSSVTPVALVDDADTSAGFTVNRTVTTAATSGSVLYGPRGWNIRMPDEMWFVPETLPRVDAGSDPLVLTMSAPADSVTVSGTMIIEEI